MITESVEELTEPVRFYEWKELLPYGRKKLPIFKSTAEG